MQEIQLMKEMEALRAQLQQKEQALEDYKESDRLYHSSTDCSYIEPRSGVRGQSQEPSESEVRTAIRALGMPHEPTDCPRIQ